MRDGGCAPDSTPPGGGSGAAGSRLAALLCIGRAAPPGWDDDDWLYDSPCAVASMVFDWAFTTAMGVPPCHGDVQDFSAFCGDRYDGSRAVEFLSGFGPGCRRLPLRREATGEGLASALDALRARLAGDAAGRRNAQDARLRRSAGDRGASGRSSAAVHTLSPLTGALLRPCAAAVVLDGPAGAARHAAARDSLLAWRMAGGVTVFVTAAAAALAGARGSVEALLEAAADGGPVVLASDDSDFLALRRPLNIHRVLCPSPDALPRLSRRFVLVDRSSSPSWAPLSRAPGSALFLSVRGGGGDPGPGDPGPGDPGPYTAVVEGGRDSLLLAAESSRRRRPVYYVPSARCDGGPGRTAEAVGWAWRQLLTVPCPAVTGRPEDGLLLHARFLLMASELGWGPGGSPGPAARAASAMAAGGRADDSEGRGAPGGGRGAAGGGGRGGVLLVENRACPAAAMSAFVSAGNLPADSLGRWRVVVACTDSAWGYYRRALSAFGGALRRVRLGDWELPSKGFDIEAYNALCKSSAFWDRVAEHCSTALLVQGDGVLARPGAGSHPSFRSMGPGGGPGGGPAVEYVGAPWAPCPGLAGVAGPALVGNGGLSLRDVAACAGACREAESSGGVAALFDMAPHMTEPEDVFFSARLRTAGRSDAASFSSEQVLTPGSLGYHQFWRYHRAADTREHLDGLIADAIADAFAEGRRGGRERGPAPA